MRHLRHLSSLGIGILILCLPASSVRATNILLNGSFDVGTYSFGGDGGQDLPPGSTTITGWKVITNDVAPISISNGFSIIPEDGTVSLDLQSYNDGSPYGGVQQTIPTIPGATYALSFWIGVQNNISYAVGPASVRATAGATTNDFTNTLAGAGNQWQQFTMNFVAVNPMTDISLAGLSTQGGAYIGLDNADVEFISVPEPAGLSLALIAAVMLFIGAQKSACPQRSQAARALDQIAGQKARSQEWRQSLRSSALGAVPP